MYNENFMGMNSFIWFSGVVENRNDPEKAGRVKVRILGYHTENKQTLPTADLPWALVMLPITSAGTSGIGSSPVGLLEGSWVFGFFRDGQYAQEPMILGSLPGRPIAAADPTKGFNDPNGLYPKAINEPDTNRLAINNPSKPSPSLEQRRNGRVLNVQAYNGEWSQPNIAYEAVYPYNNVYETSSGHVVEFDDTPNAERIHVRHKSGSSIEINPSGDTISIVKGNSYTLIDENNNVYIQGNSDITVNGNANLRAVGDVGILANNIDMTATGNITVDAGGNVSITGTRIDLNKD